MRAGAGFNATRVGTAVPTAAHSAWHSPVPFLFGGIAAMLGVIALALLMLACSYWKISSGLEGEREAGDDDSGVKRDCEPVKGQRYPEAGVVVIMAGNEIPTFLATPIASRANLFGDRSCSGKMDVVDAEKLDEVVSVSIFVPMENENQDQRD